MRLIARCVLPVPIGPARRTFSPRAIQSQRASSANLAQPRRQRVERHRRGRLGGPEREEQRLASLERALHPLGGDALTQLDDGAQYLSEDAGGLLGPALVAELAPEGIERWPEVADQLVGDLAHRLGLLGQLGQVMPVVDGAAAERLA